MRKWGGDVKEHRMGDNNQPDGTNSPKLSRMKDGISLFSAMKNRDDLPKMRLPLTMVFILSVALLSAVSVRLMSRPSTPGIIALMLFLPGTLCGYTLLVLLWRRWEAFLATPVSVALMLLFGGKPYLAAAAGIGLFTMTYVFALSFFRKESRFYRVMSLWAAACAVVILSMTAGILINFSSPAEFFETVITETAAYFTEAYEKAGAAVDPAVFRDALREMTVLGHSYISMVSIILVWIADFFMAKLMESFKCREDFVGSCESWSLSKGFSAVYFGVLCLTLITSSADNPMIYAMLKSVTLIMILPAALAGVIFIFRKLEDKLYHFTREKTLAAIILGFALLFMGTSLFLLAASAVGAASTIFPGKIKNENNNS